MPPARAALSFIGFIAPPVAAEIAYAAWRSLGTPESVHPLDRRLHDEASKGTITVNGHQVRTYAWGDGPRFILLVHGWRSRASRFSTLVERLRSPEHTIVAFEAPGNGDSPGRGTTILDYTAAIRQLVANHGTPEAIIGHSFGALSAFLAVRESVPTRRLVAIAGMADANGLVEQFSRAIGIGPRAERGLRRRIERRVFPQIVNPWRRFIAEIDPADLHVPLLLVHDADDAVVPVTELPRIAESHTGEVVTLVTSGHGHNRILRDPEVVEKIVGFVNAALPTRSAASSPGNRSRS